MIKGKAHGAGGSIDTEAVGKDVSVCEQDLRMLNVLKPILKSMLRETKEILGSVRIKRKGIKRAVQLKSKGGSLRLNLGCGPSKRPGFVGLDLSPDADIQWDIHSMGSFF